MAVTKIRSWLLLALAIEGLVGCGYESRHARDRKGDYPAPTQVAGPVTDSIAEVSIDTDATLTHIDPGNGVGLFIEYQTGGSWHVTTSCDTAASRYGCDWSILTTSVGGIITGFTQDQLELGDWVDYYGNDSVLLTASNAFDIDGMYVQAAAGATLRLDALLDGDFASRYVYWAG
ncbi:MAG TPA: hypothetical protein VGJ84_07845, partial [Polyangiaceae bacterium]